MENQQCGQCQCDPCDPSKFGLTDQDRDTIMKMYGTVPTYLEKMPTTLGSLFVESMQEVENFKSDTIPQKYLILALYTQSLVIENCCKQILYERLCKKYGISQEELDVAIELVSFFSIFSTFTRTAMFPDRTVMHNNDKNMVEFLKQTLNIENSYNPNYIVRCASSKLGLSLEKEKEAIKQFGAIPMIFNLIPTKYADNLWKKWTFTTQTTMPPKIRYLLILVILGSTRHKNSDHAAIVDVMTKFASLHGLTQEELIDVTTLLAFNTETDVWMRSQHYTKDQFTAEVETSMKTRETMKT